MNWTAKLKDGIPTLSETDIEMILHMNPMRKNTVTREAILRNLETLRRDWAEHQVSGNSGQLPDKPKVTFDLPPCPQCGGISFLRTGTCHVCQTCGSSQGCS